MKRSQSLIVVVVSCFLWFGCGSGELVPAENATIYKVMQDTADELGVRQGEVKLDPSASIHGKTAIVVHWNDTLLEKPEDYQIEGFTQAFDGIAKAKVLDLWGLTPETVPTDPSEIETLVRVTCAPGDRIGTFPAVGRPPVPVYRMDCLVDVLDYKTKTIFSQKTFRNAEIDPHTRVLPIDNEVLAAPPYDDIRRYVRNFKRE